MDARRNELLHPPVRTLALHIQRLSENPKRLAVWTSAGHFNFSKSEKFQIGFSYVNGTVLPFLTFAGI